MSVLKVGDLQEKLHLFESSVAYMWVMWEDPNIINVFNCGGEAPLPRGEYTIDRLIEKKDIEKLIAYRGDISTSISNHYFSITNKGKKSNIKCSSQKTEDGIICLWVVIPEKDNTILFLQNAAHDFRSPLGSIIGLVNLMQNSLNEESEINRNEMLTYLDMIKMNGNKSLNLASEILELAEIESNTYQLKVVPLELKEFVKRYIDTHRLLALKKRIKVDFIGDSSARAFINESKLTRALDNVLSNSVKFSKEESTITFSLVEEDDKLIVEISDQGIGMSDEILRNVFVKFGNSKRSGLNGEPSHGLGMSIVRQIMQLHEGDVEVFSSVGEGTCVRMIFNKVV